MPIVIDFLANVKGLLKGTDDAEKAFADVADSLDDLVRSGDKAGDKLGDGIKDGADDAERAVEQLEPKFKDLADVSRRESKQAGDALGTNIKRGTTEAEGGLKDFKEESASTAKESAASFDGSAESIVDAFQEVAANAFIGFGPAGLVAGLAAAAGIGLVSAEIVNGTELGEEIKQKIADLTTELITSGTEGAPSIEYLADKLEELATATDGVNLKELAKTAQESGSDYRDLAQAFAGNTNGLKDLWREGDRRLKQLQDEADATDTTTSAGAARYSTLLKQSDAQQRYRDYLGQSIGVSKEAAEAERNYAAAGGPELAAKSEALDEYATGVQDALTKSGEAWETYTHDGVVSLDEYNAAIEAQAAAITAYQGNVVTATQTLSQEALNYIISLGPEAAPLLQAYVDAPLEQKERTAANWATLGTAAAENYTGNLKAGIPATVDGPSIVARLDLDQANADLDQFRRGSYTVGVGVLLRPGSSVDQ